METKIDNIRYECWRNGFVKQHNLSEVKKYLNGVFSYKQIKLGNIKKGEGDIVIIGLGKNEFIDFEEYISYTHSIKEIKTIGIYTNIYWSRDFFTLLIQEITK